MDLPQRAQVVVIGGGIIGCSVAYHLAQQGWTDVVLLERDQLTSGTTWHAAGLMTCFGSTSETNTAIRLYSRDLYARLEAETGVATGFKPVGLIEAAADADRLHEYRRVAAFQRMHGLEVEEISPREIADLFPWARTDDLHAGFHIPGDGRVNPVDVTQSLARGAKNLGVRIIESVSVLDVLTEKSGLVEKVTGVVVSTPLAALAGSTSESNAAGSTDESRAAGSTNESGAAGSTNETSVVEEGREGRATRLETTTIECDYVVNCTGMWARELGERSGLIIPNQAAEHYYLITDTIEGLSSDTPIFEDPAAHGYYREEGGGMMVGLFEPRAAAWSVDGIPRDASYTTLKPDWDRMAPFLETAMARVPITEEAGIRTFFCGPESFTPDLAPAVGEAPGIRGYFVAAGMNSVGILSAGGLGRVLAEWIVSGQPQVDVTGFDVARFRPHQLEPAYRSERTVEILGTVYAAHAPGKQLTTMRGALLSPVHDRMVAAGAYLREVSGWESAAWYAAPGSSPTASPSWGRSEWWSRWEAEHRAVRETVGLMDMSFMAKFRVTGAQAGAVLSRVSSGLVDGEDDRITYTQWLDDDGRIRADLTVTKEAGGSYLVVASDTAHGSALDWLRRACLPGEDVEIVDVTRDLAQLNLQGPASRDLLASLTDADLSTASYPFRTSRVIEIAGVAVRCARITYVGELGYELYVPAESAGVVWDALVAAGPAYGLRLAGLHALASLRLEKAYRDYGHDIDNTDCPLAVGLGFAVDWEHDFTGRDALQARRGEPMPGRLVCLRITSADREEATADETDPLLFEAEPVLRDGEIVGDIRAASYGWTVGGPVALAYVNCVDGVTKEWLESGTWSVDIAGAQHDATVSLRPFYDPTSARVRT